MSEVTKYSTTNLRKTIFAGILAALSFILMRFTEFPIFPSVSFLTTDLGDIPFLYGAIYLGPWYAVGIVFVKNLLFFLSGGSPGGIIGLIANFIALSTFGIVVGFITLKRKNPKNVILGLVSGAIAFALVMIPTNLWAVPLYLPGITREELITYLYTVNLPFNLLKGAIDTGITLAVYLSLRKHNPMK